MTSLEQITTALSKRYRLQRELGRGGMATVFLARDSVLDRDVALKVLLPELTVSLAAERFLREITIAAKLKHPNILSLHDSGRTGEQEDGPPEDFLYYVMPYVAGESLRERLEREKQLPIDEALRIAADVARGLHHAHEQGVVHRDIKPENILLHDDHVLVSDFGVAKAVTEAGGEKLTNTGITVGTVSYMSPEQGAADKEIDGRSDLYSLGCVLYEMIGGVPPFTGPSDQAILARHQRETPPALSTIRTSTPPGVEALIEQSLAKNPVDRYKTAEHMRLALSDPKIAAVGTGARLRRTMKFRAARMGAGVAVTAAAVLGLWRFLPTGGGLEAGMVAVLPFEVTDSMEKPLDAVSITNLLRSNFGYLERYRVVQVARVRQAVDDLCPTPPVERSCGSLVAAELRSQYHVTGTVTPVREDSVQIVAYLTDEMERRSIPPVSIRGSRADGYSLVRELFRELAAASAGEGEMVVANVALSTESLDALAAFMNGELYLANGDFGRAGGAFRRATDADSTFALAWYRLALIRDWFGNTAGASIAAAQAETYADELSAHDRRLLQAHRAHIEGDAAAAEREYLELLEEDPDDFEALMQLGYFYFPGRQAVDPLRRAMRLTPHPLAGVYLVWGLMAGSVEDPSMLDEADSLAHTHGFDQLVLGITAVRAIRAGDSLGLAVVMDSVRRITNLFDAMIAVPQFMLLGTSVGDVPDLAMYVDLIKVVSDSSYLDQRLIAINVSDPDRRELVAYEWRELGHVFGATFEAGRGRWNAARAALQALGEMGGPAAAVMAVKATTPMPGAVPVDADSLRRELEEWDVDGLPLNSRFAGGVENIWDQIRMYLLGLLSAQVGEYQVARAYAAQLEAVEPYEFMPTLHSHLALRVLADILLREDRPVEALAVLEDAPRREPLYVDRIIGEHHVQLRARALHRLGRYDEALRWYTVNAHSYSFVPFLAPSHYYRGQIHEELGNSKEALWHYQAFVELWREADPEYQPVVEDVKDRMARLTAEG